MEMRFNPCAIIPVFDHEGPLPGIVARLKPYHIPCILIDDGSGESCASVIRGLAAQEPWLQHIRQNTNGGKGSAVKTGLFAAWQQGFSHAVQIDADGQHDVGDLDKFLSASRAHPDAVITGQPMFDHSMPKTRYYARYLTHIWVWINTLSFSIADSMCGYRVYPVAACVQLLGTATLGDRMQFDVEILIRSYWQGSQIISIPIRVRYPEDGVSHFRLWADNALLSLMQARLFFGMLRRLPRLVGRHFR